MSIIVMVKVILKELQFGEGHEPVKKLFLEKLNVVKEKRSLKGVRSFLVIKVESLLCNSFL